VNRPSSEALNSSEAAWSISLEKAELPSDKTLSGFGLRLSMPGSPAEDGSGRGSGMRRLRTSGISSKGGISKFDIGSPGFR
jgi:hypothetical protein